MQVREGGSSASAAWRRRAGWLNLGLGAAFVASFVAFAIRAQYQVPYADDWDWLISLQEPAPFTESLWRPHNEHFIVVPRLLVWLDFWLWGWPGYAALAAGLLCHASIASMLIATTVDLHPSWLARLLSGSILALLFLTYQLQGVVFPAATVAPLVACFGIGSVWLLTLGAATVTPWRRLTYLVSSAAACVLALLSLTNALVLPWLLAGLARLARVPMWVAALYAVIGVAALVAHAASGGMPVTSIHTWPLREAYYAVAFLGGPLAAVSAPFGATIGATVVAATLWLCWRALRRVSDVTRSEWMLLTILLFVLASAAMAGLGRAHLGVNNAAQSRYVILTSTAWCCLLVLLVPRQGMRAGLERVIATALPVIAALMLPLRFLVGVVWVAKADHLSTAALACRWRPRRVVAVAPSPERTDHDRPGGADPVVARRRVSRSAQG